MILFYLRDDPYGFLSNFHRARQVVDAVIYATNEHYYQSQRTTDRRLREWIRNAPTPFLAMIAGRTLREGKELSSDWNASTKVGVMLKGLRAKFTQNEGLKEALLSTGNEVIHEDSKTDMFWGWCDGKGKDKLGYLLMIIRDELRLEEKE